MKHFHINPVFFVFITIAFFFYLPSSASDHQTGQIIVILKPRKDVNVLIKKHPDNIYGLPAIKEISKTMNIWLLSYNTSIDETYILNSIRKDEDVTVAQYNYFLQERATPDDSLFPQQWNLYNYGQTGGISGADIDAPDAWNITTGGVTATGDTIVIAVIDGGFDLTHPDLNFWKNYKEIPGNGIDDDGDGYIDDYDGWSGAGNDSIPIGDPHGTHVAGIAGAWGNNGTGIAGVNWNVKIMPLYYYGFTDADVITCYSFAYHLRKIYNTSHGDTGAFIVATNSSFGINYGKPADHPVWCAMYDSLGSVGILSAAAGPDSTIDVDTEGDIPTTCPSDWLIAVTNTTNTDNLQASAGWGAINMDLGAPGTKIWSTVPYIGYEQMTGTSMSSPHVAGAVALMWAAACEKMVASYKANPSGYALIMKNIMLANVDTLPALTGKTVSDGRLNLYKCLLGVQNYCTKYLAVDELSKGQNIYNVYPNPATTTVNIELLPSSVSKPVSLILTDVVGRNMFVPFIEKISGQQEDETLQLDLTGLSSGMYFIKIVTEGNNYYYVQKLIVK